MTQYTQPKNPKNFLISDVVCLTQNSTQRVVRLVSSSVKPVTGEMCALILSLGPIQPPNDTRTDSILPQFDIEPGE